MIFFRTAHLGGEFTRPRRHSKHLLKPLESVENSGAAPAGRAAWRHGARMPIAAMATAAFTKACIQLCMVSMTFGRYISVPDITGRHCAAGTAYSPRRDMAEGWASDLPQKPSAACETFQSVELATRRARQVQGERARRQDAHYATQQLGCQAVLEGCTAPVEPLTRQANNPPGSPGNVPQLAQRLQAT